MSRYTGPAWKVSRRLGFSTLETGKELAKRPYGPGQHGENKRKKNSEYGKQLIEKQKLRMMYGVSERQFQRLFKIAKADKNAVTGTKFMQILESRLDNLVYRFGFAKTRRAARQLVNHGHITVNGAKVDIPSYICSVGDVITLKESSKELKVVKEALESLLIVAPYLELDKEKMVGKYTRIPERNELNKEITESQIVEFYNRKL
ncbi:MAG: 30S ribosomal protein S4 [Bacilli bacterium]|nr:30S ribosomal protein S4 [Erysipelotrichaceae bacterium]MDD6249706.1 30S ribosomal protein S4 [Bacillales bacterium]MDY2746740.1 30S ribosomal protein S4 [Bacilli bacterium]MDD7381667.1 30S ribosomal protein S4 [Bacillales bacterium]MDY3889744.1 30S ribosomal protein S4 [Bacilli bacterium]